MSAMISVKARSPCRWCWPTGAVPKLNGLSGANAIEGGNSDDQALEKALGLITKYGSLKDTTARAEHYASIARDALAPLPDSAEKRQRFWK
jgi:geranylgeranyl pyrophosphate synthase